MNTKYTIEIDTHTHTIASTHAYGTLSENLEQAAKRGLKAIAITDHGPLLPDSPHPWHFYNMRILPRIINGIIILRGIEANIMDTEGNLDLEDDFIKKLDWVIASFHKQTFTVVDSKIHTKALIAAASNKNVDILGHLDAPEYPFDIKEVVSACKESGVFIEMNASSARVRKGGEETCRKIAIECMNQGVPVLLNSDAHCPWDVGEVSAVASILESISFPLELLMNHKADKLLDFIETKRNRKLRK